MGVLKSMKLYYAKSTGGFYNSEIHGANIPFDAVEITAAEHADLMAGQSAGRIIIADNNGRPILSAVCPGPDYIWNGAAWVFDAAMQRTRITVLIQAHMDAKAQAYGYDNILSAKSYVTSTNTKWRAEGEAFRNWQDAVWEFGLALLAAQTSGTNTITTDADLIAALPVFPLD
jgi:hypothetical protein